MSARKVWNVGDWAKLTVDVTEDLVRDFAEWSGDRNPLHLDADYAGMTRFHRRVAHGMSFGALFSRLIGMDLPGPGALWTSQSFKFSKPAFLGDRLVLSVEVSAVAGDLLTLDCRAVNQLDEEIMSGTGEVMFVGPALDDSPDAVAETSKTALVTGAGRGIGEAIARRLDAMGFNLGLTYRNARMETERLAGSLTAASAIEADLSDPAQAAAAVVELRRRFGPVTSLVLNAGDRDLYGPAAGDEFAPFARHFTVQIESAHAAVSAALPDMQAAGGGAIVAIGSTYAIGAPPPNMAPYIVAKAALAGWIRSLASDFGRENIRANLVAPGMTETALLSGVPDRQKKVAAIQNPMRRLGRPNDVAGAVAFLISEDGAYVNGETLVVSGGATMS